MRTAKTHVRHHGEKGLKLISDNSIPVLAQKSEFKKLCSNPANEKIAEAHYQESDGPLRVVRFLTPTELKAKNEAQAKAEADARKHAEAQSAKVAAKPAKPAANKLPSVPAK